MAKVKVVFLLASMASMASAGCRYANPEWDMTQISLSAPSIQVALTEQVDKIVAKWNESLISQKSQCVDKINLFADDVMLCSVAPLQQRCESASELTCGTDNLNTVRFWLTLVNEDHKDGPQNVRAPSLTSVDKLCSGEDPTVSIAASEHCEAIITDWNEEPRVEFLSGRRGLRHVTMKWVNSDLKGYECVDFFEVKYWPRGKASRSFVTSAIEAKKDRKDRVYSTMLEVDECTEYTYLIRASKSNPSVVINHRGSFQSKCKSGRVISNKSNQQEQSRTSPRPPTPTRSTTTTTTPTASTTSTTAMKSTTTTTTTTKTTSSTTTSTTTTTTTTIRTTPTQTTILTSMLFSNSENEDLTERSETLDKMLFKESDHEKEVTKPTPRLPKVSSEIFETTTEVTEIKVTRKLSVTTTENNSNVTSTSKVEIENTMQQDQAQVDEIDREIFEYVENGIEEEKKYLESAIGVPHGAEESEPNEIISNYHHDDATDFDELLARTQESTLGKNGRSLDLQQGSYSGATYGQKVQFVTWLFSCSCFYTVRVILG